MTVTEQELQESDNRQLQAYHYKIVLTAGMGFFTDAYDLFVIGVVTALLIPLWHLTTTQVALLNGAALAAAAVGSVCFGTLADKFGRKKLYGIEVAVLFVGAILSMLCTSFMGLLITRIIVGLGIGGDYPCSALIVSESANVKNRGTLVLMVFGMQALGLLIGPSIAALLLTLHIDHEIIWRTLLGLGALPAASVFWLRRKISESPHYLVTQESLYQVSHVVADLAGYKPEQHPPHHRAHLWQRPWLLCLLGTAGAWFFLDIAFYGNSVSSVLILRALNPSTDLLRNVTVSALIFLCCAVPGYIAAALFVDKIGRKRLQYLGFAVMGLCFILISLLPNIAQEIKLFILLFGISYFFINFGPNSTTFLIPSETYPTSLRGQAHGISAAVGKIGAFVGAFLLPFILQEHGLQLTMGLMAVMCLLGIVCTVLVPDMTGRSLRALDQ